ncbi:DNA mismatch repair protein MutS [Nitratireductor sp. CAU 1489]|uniref:DNA mismatch repair protein MutS n=1 Tax=Nitratireductor arenosus TaxID=2682096 RepID=A0A844QEY7_9HYPH|nr:Smr/MutS family protein [Nitratireductor arenosus]MVA96648.1 DNA mismatch repair protein MutS [Nitratireductor arenosus]
MRKRATSGLTEQDRILWEQVARTTTPLKGRREQSLGEVAPPSAAAQKDRADARSAPVAAAPRPHAERKRETGGGIDRPTRQKLAKGRVALEASVDLHGMTQSQAHGLLLSFLMRAHAAGLRHVLVITGKGVSFGSEGVLRQAVPGWLATPSFRAIVGGFEAAARHHGGNGALYIRLRRAGDARRL